MDQPDVWFRVRGTVQLVFTTFLLLTVMPALKFFFFISPTFKKDMVIWSEQIFKDSPIKIDDPSLGVSWAMIRHIICSIRFLTYCCVYPGSKAHNSRLHSVDKKAETRLSDYAKPGRPLVVNFGSCTSPPWVAKIKDFKQLMSDFKGVADFLIIYTKEAHPSDGWKYHSNPYQIASHRTLNDRLNSAENLKRFKLLCPVAVDAMDDNCTYAYAAVNERLYIVLNENCVYKGGLGPDEYNIDEVRNWLQYYAKVSKKKTRNQ